MIDVLLVLLVFFVMITSAEVLKVDKNLTLPISPNAKQREPEMAKHEMAVNIRYDAATNKGVLVVDDRIFGDWQEVVSPESIETSDKTVATVLHIEVLEQA